MKKLFFTLIASMLLLGNFSYGGTFGLSGSDASRLFGKNTHKIHAVKLTHVKMAKAKGKWGFSIGGFGFRGGYHGPHHNFGGFIGWSNHYQINGWRHGVKGSGWVVRIPWGWW